VRMRTVHNTTNEQLIVDVNVINVDSLARNMFGSGLVGYLTRAHLIPFFIGVIRDGHNDSLHASLLIYISSVKRYDMAFLKA